MNQIVLSLSILLFVNPVFSKDKHNHHAHAKSLGAHEHGMVKLEVAVEGKIIELDLDGPAESFIGFEYTPKTKKEKKLFSDAHSLWTKGLLTKLFIIDKKLECSVSDASFKQVIDGDDAKKESGIHSEIEAKAKITCAQNVEGKSILVNVKKDFPHIKKLSIDLIGSETKSVEAKTTEEIKL